MLIPFLNTSLHIVCCQVAVLVVPWAPLYTPSPVHTTLPAPQAAELNKEKEHLTALAAQLSEKSNQLAAEERRLAAAKADAAAKEASLATMSADLQKRMAAVQAAEVEAAEKLATANSKASNAEEWRARLAAQEDRFQEALRKLEVREDAVSEGVARGCIGEGRGERHISNCASKRVLLLLVLQCSDAGDAGVGGGERIQPQGMPVWAVCMWAVDCGLLPDCQCAERTLPTLAACPCSPCRSLLLPAISMLLTHLALPPYQVSAQEARLAAAEAQVAQVDAARAEVEQRAAALAAAEEAHANIAADLQHQQAR
jgi:chemotaxis protein histidine kinase CheA